MITELKAELEQRAADGLTRRRRLLQSAQSANVLVDDQAVLSFCSNDYLGLANNSELKAAMQQGVELAGIGSGASHLVTGHHQFHDLLEQELAEFVGMDDALLFSSGYMANIGVVTSLINRHDVIFSDKLNHASLNDAAVLSRADLQRFPHNDMSKLESMLKNVSGDINNKRKLIVLDAVFSMDGDIAPLKKIVALCDQYDAYCLLDDAHGFGVLGKNGRGTLSHFALSSPRIIYMATLGKAAGVSGAFVASNQIIIDYLKQKARSYIYTTASPPALAYTLSKALAVIKNGDALRLHLNKLITKLKLSLNLKNWQLMDSPSAIQPLLVGSNEATIQLSDYLLSLDILVPAIRPPTVPAGTARLRISLTTAHSFQDIEKLIAAIHQAERNLL